MPDKPEPMQLFARQALRSALVADWFDALGLQAGDSIADLGCGAGYVALRAAERVGPTGTVHAVDSDPEAVDFLRDLAALHGLDHIHCIARPLLGLEALPARPRGALLSMVLHHLDNPADALRHVAKVVHGAPVVIAEFAADGPCRVGPPREMRLSRDAVENAVSQAGLLPQTFSRQTPEHWFLVVSGYR